MSSLREQIQQQDALGFTHSGKFHADDVFSSALLFYLNPEITILRGNRVPEDFMGIVYDIGRGQYDHHQRDSRVRENGVPYAAFGLLWEALGEEILGTVLAERFDEEFVQPLDMNDNTGEKNELATLIGNFNPSWDEEGSNDGAFFQAVSVAGMILENKFAKYRGNERADKQVEDYLETLRDDIAAGGKSKEDAQILIMPQFVPCQKKLSETEVAFVIFPSNRGGYCIQPQKKEYSMNYKCSFPESWLGLENEALQETSGLSSASFCHKGGFLMTVGKLEDAVMACKLSRQAYVEEPVVVVFTSCAEQKRTEDETSHDAVQGCDELAKLAHQLPGMQQACIHYVTSPALPEFTIDGIYAEAALEKPEWKQQIKGMVKQILAKRPEAVIVEGTQFYAYPIIHALRKKHMPVLICIEAEGRKLLTRIPSGS